MSPVLSVSSITVVFGGLRAIQDVSFEVQAGEILGLIGPNGAGKTTIFGVISGFIHHAAHGAVHYEGRDITSLVPYKRALLGIGRTFQIVQPFAHLSVLDNVVAGLVARGHKVGKAKDIAAEVLDRLKLGSRMNTLARNLTLPEKKRLEMARAVAPAPTLLLLDEVLAGLTPTEVDEILPVLLDIRRNGTSILVIEHVMRAVMAISDRIVVLASGEKIAEGTPQEVTRDPAVINSYLGSDKHGLS